jgi:hypothetical protein
MAGEYASMLMGPSKPSVSVEVAVEGPDEYDPSDAEVAVAADIIAASRSGDARSLACAIHAAFMHQTAMHGMGED